MSSTTIMIHISYPQHTAKVLSRYLVKLFSYYHHFAKCCLLIVFILTVYKLFTNCFYYCSVILRLNSSLPIKRNYRCFALKIGLAYHSIPESTIRHFIKSFSKAPSQYYVSFCIMTLPTQLISY